MNLSTAKWAHWDEIQSRELLGLFVCVCIALCTIVAHNIAQNRPDNFLSYPPDNHHCSDDVCLREGGGGGAWMWESWVWSRRYESCYLNPASSYTSWLNDNIVTDAVITLVQCSCHINLSTLPSVVKWSFDNQLVCLLASLSLQKLQKRLNWLRCPCDTDSGEPKKQLLHEVQIPNVKGQF